LRRRSGGGGAPARAAARSSRRRGSGAGRGGLDLAFYRAEGEVERAAEAVAARSVAPAPLMPAARCGRRVGEGEGVEAVVAEWGGALMA
jgi:hypothetical protein